MHVIGVGFGRTGTASLKLALERLGAGPCYHMADVVAEPTRARAWLAAAQGQPSEWSEIFAGFSSTVDWPGAAFWRELLDEYPRAKAILTVRDSQRWYDSMENTILPAWRRRREQSGGPATDAGQQDFGAMTEAVLARRVFDGRAEDRAHAVATFERHLADVRASVPAERLLVFEVAQGWQPLCAFLDVPVPDEPFPRANDGAAFNQRQTTLPRQTPPEGHQPAATR